MVDVGAGPECLHQDASRRDERTTEATARPWDRRDRDTPHSRAFGRRGDEMDVVPSRHERLALLLEDAGVERDMDRRQVTDAYARAPSPRARLARRKDLSRDVHTGHVAVRLRRHQLTARAVTDGE